MNLMFLSLSSSSESKIVLISIKDGTVSTLKLVGRYTALFRPI